MINDTNSFDDSDSVPIDDCAGDAFDRGLVEPITSIQRATRNALTLSWLHSLLPECRAIIVAYRAAVLDCPAIEVDETFESPDEVDWLYHRYAVFIDRNRLSR